MSNLVHKIRACVKLRKRVCVVSRNLLFTQMVCAQKTGNKQPRIALALYGLFRAVPFTFENIKSNLIAPLLQETPFLDIFLHSLLVSRSIVERGGNKKTNAPDHFAFIKFNETRRLCSFEVQNQLVVDADNRISERVKEEWAAAGNRNLRFGHHYTKESFANILRATYSLFAVSKSIRAREREARFKYTHLVFARPDVRLQGPFRYRDFPLRVPGHVIMVANTQHHGGLNDRFAFGTREAMLHLSTQFEAEAAAAVSRRGRNSEQRRAAHLGLLYPNVTVAFTPLCLVRVRSTGAVVANDLISKRQPFRPLPRLLPLLRPEIDKVQPCGGAAS